MAAENGADRAALQSREHLLLLALVQRLDLDAAGRRGGDERQVGDARHRQRFAKPCGPAHRVAREVLDIGDRHAHRHP